MSASTISYSFSSLHMPAEWEPHEATWIAWPHHESDWPEKFPTIQWVYVEIVRALGKHERIEILCHNQQILSLAKHCLSQEDVSSKQYRLHLVPNNRSWLRDSAPTAVKKNDGEIMWVHWGFNAWAKYSNFELDEQVPLAIERLSGLKRLEAKQDDVKQKIVLEGGAFDTDGQGTLLVTEECLLSPIQERNPGFSRKDYEAVFEKYLGIKKTIWLAEGCVGDDTHGHIDDVARFVKPRTVVLAFEKNSHDPNHQKSIENLKRLQEATDASGQKLDIVLLPMPRPITFEGERLPASYANFYIANGVVLVPTFNDRNDKNALQILSELFPDREVIGIHAVDLVLGLGTLHCLTQQQPVNV